MVEIKQYQSRILQCAAAIVKNEGQKALSVANICRHCNISKRSFYECYASKNELIRSLITASGEGGIPIPDEKDMILQTAERCFGQYGFHNVDMEMIAAAAGVRRGVIYKYFKNKDQLLEWCVVAHFDKIKKIATGMYLDNAADPVAFITEYFTGFSAFIGNSHGSVFFAEIWNQISFRKRLHEHIKDLQDFFIDLFQKSFSAGIEQGVFRNDLRSGAVAKIMTIAINGMAFFFMIDPEPDCIGSVRDEFLNLMFKAIRKKE